MKTVFCYLHNTSGIEVFLKTREVASMEIQGSWCYTRGNRAASTLSGEPSVPGEIPGGVARGSIPGASGVDPGRGAVCSREDSRRYDVLSYTSGAASRGGIIDILCLYQVRSMFCLYQGCESLFTPAALWRWAFRRPIHARGAITTGLAWLTSWRPLSGRWHLLRQVGLAYLQYCRRLSSAI